MTTTSEAGPDTLLTTAAAPLAAPGTDERVTRLGVVQRVILVLDAFTDAPGRLLLEDVCRITALPRSTAFRILRQLVDLHWVEHNTTGYALGPRAEQLTGRTADYEDLRVAAHIPLNELHLATRAVVHLSVLEGGTVHYLDKVGGPASSSVPSRVGARIPASETVSGRALLACLDAEDVDRIMRTTRGASTDLSGLHRELAEARARQGMAMIVRGLRETGISSMAVPVFGPRGPVAAISVAVRGELPRGRAQPLLLGASRATTCNLFPDWTGGARRRSGEHLRLTPN